MSPLVFRFLLNPTGPTCVFNFFSFCLQRLLCIAFQNKENLFLPIFVIFFWEEPASSHVFFCFLILLALCCLMAHAIWVM